MKKVISAALIFFAASLCAHEAYAHYPILLLNKSPIAVKQRDSVAFFYGRGHLYKREWSKSPKPDWVKVVNFDGMTRDVSSKLQSEGKHYKFSLQLNRPGDTWVVVHTPLEWSDHDMCWVETTLRSVVHIGFSKGWQEPLGLAKLEMLPLTRPYGLLPGDVMRVKVMKSGKPVPNQMVYAERYYNKPPAGEAPPIELLMRSAQTDGGGAAGITLRKSGWWVIFTVLDDGEQTIKGKKGLVQREDALWVHVE